MPTESYKTGSHETQKKSLIEAMKSAKKRLKTAEQQGDQEMIIRETEMIKGLYRDLIGFTEAENPDAIVVLDAGVTLKNVRQVNHESQETKLSQHNVPTSYEDGLKAVEPPPSSVYKRYKTKKVPRGYMIGSPGGKPRAIAGAELATYFTGAKIVNTSRYPLSQQLPPTEKLPDENHYAVYTDYEEALGIDPERIITEPDSTNTLEMLIQLVKMAKDNNWTRIVIITNDYHKRVLAFWEALANKESAQEQLAYSLAQLDLLSQDTQNNDAKLNKENAAKASFKDTIGYSVSHGDNGEPMIHFDEQNDFFDIARKLKIHIVAAENILPARNQKYEAVIRDEKNTNAYQRLTEGEEKGVAQIRDGTYNQAAYKVEYQKIHPYEAKK